MPNDLKKSVYIALWREDDRDYSGVYDSWDDLEADIRGGIVPMDAAVYSAIPLEVDVRVSFRVASERGKGEET